MEFFFFASHSNRFAAHERACRMGVGRMTRSPPQVQGNPERVIETSVQFGGKVCHYRLGVKECDVLPHEKQRPLQGRAGARRLRSPVSERGHRFQSQLCRELQGLASGAEPLQPSVSATPRSKCWTA